MKRSVPLCVDRLEDRCVPAVDVLTDPTAGTVTLTNDDGSVETSVIVTDDGTQSFVIDVYLNDPSALPPKPVETTPIPESYWSDPTEPVPPIDSPFWY
jgi:hypothetical protein